jgi:hypothetical protein
MEHLDRLLAYINSTRDLELVLEPGRSLELIAYIDAADNIHEDAKGHTGIVVSIGGGPVYAESTRQQIVTKSSSETELVAQSDGLSMIIWCRDFIMDQGVPLGPATLMQDNQSAIALATKGKSDSKRSKHINKRYFFIKDRIDAGEVMLEHLGTEDMIADVLTKPMTGRKFERLRTGLLLGAKHM